MNQQRKPNAWDGYDSRQPFDLETTPLDKPRGWGADDWGGLRVAGCLMLEKPGFSQQAGFCAEKDPQARCAKRSGGVEPALTAHSLIHD